MTATLYPGLPRLERAKDTDICANCPVFLGSECDGGHDPGAMREIRKSNERRRRDGKVEILPACPRDYAYYFKVSLIEADRPASVIFARDIDGNLIRYNDEIVAYRAYINSIDQLVSRREMLTRMKGLT